MGRASQEVGTAHAKALRWESQVCRDLASERSVLSGPSLTGSLLAFGTGERRPERGVPSSRPHQGKGWPSNEGVGAGAKDKILEHQAPSAGLRWSWKRRCWPQTQGPGRQVSGTQPGTTWPGLAWPDEGGPLQGQVAGLHQGHCDLGQLMPPLGPWQLHLDRGPGVPRTP